MKKVTEKDLSLDKQVVSNLSGGTDNRDETDGLVCASNVCTDSHFEICCAVSEEYTCPEQCPQVKTVDICPVTNNSLCDDCTDFETCICPVTDTQVCPVTETRHC